MIAWVKEKVVAILAVVAAVFGVLGFGLKDLLNLEDNTRAWIALAFVAALCAVLIAAVFVDAIRRLRKKYPEGYIVLSNSTSVTTADGRNYVFETLRHIQVKQSIQASVSQTYQWTGSIPPQVSSDLQKVGDIVPQPDGSRSVNLSFYRARRYDEVETIHMRQEVDDSAQTALPLIGTRVTEPLQVIDFTARLLHSSASYSGKAYFERFRIGAQRTSATIEPLGEVIFDQRTKSFEKTCPNPEVGFVYCLRWDRP